MKKSIMMLVAVMAISFPSFCEMIVDMRSISTDVFQSEVEGVGDSAIFNFDFDITAIGNDVFIPTDSSNIEWVLNPSTVGKVDVTYTLTSTADIWNGYYTIDEGDSENFNFIISLTAIEDCMASIGIEEIGSFSHRPRCEWRTERVPLNADAVPEPTTIAMFGIGAFIVAILRRRITH